jgi:hypothetical protein
VAARAWPFCRAGARLNPIEIAVIGATLYFGGSALRRSPWRSRGLGYRTSKACAHCGIHPSARDIQEPVSNFLISCQLSKAHAFAGVVHTFFVGGHGGCSLITGGAGKEPYPAILDQARRKTEVPARHMRMIAAASTEKTSTRPIGHCPTAVYGDYRSIVVRALAARSPDLLGRAKRSSPKAARLRAAGAGLDGESADRAIIISPRCASSSSRVVATPHFASPTSWLPLNRELQKGSELLSTPSLPPPIYVFSDVLC